MRLQFVFKTIFVIELVALLLLGSKFGSLAALLAPLLGICIPLDLWHHWGEPLFQPLAILSMAILASLVGLLASLRLDPARGSKVLGVGSLVVYSISSVAAFAGLS